MAYKVLPMSAKPATPPSPAGAEPRHPIQVVARRTGLSADVIRAWERRYQAVAPIRSAASRRLYSDAEVGRLRLLYLATQGGRRIGDVARLPTGALEDLVAADRAAAVPRHTAPVAGQVDAGDYLSQGLAAVDRMDPAGLDDVLSRAAVAMTVPALLDRLVAPFMSEIGERWHAGTLRIAQEHMASSVVRSFLGALQSTANLRSGGPVIVVTTPLGQDHELGALMVAVTATVEGWQPVHLGSNTPAPEVAAAALRTGARVVALSIAYPPDDPRVAEELRRLRRQLPEEVGILVGGRAADGYSDAIAGIGADRLEDLVALRARLDQLRSGGSPR